MNEQARHQLYLLTGESDPVMNWQVFCDYDHDRKDLASGYRGTLTMLAPALLAAQQQGCGVFVSVNEFDGARKKENLLSIRALFLDFDAAPLPDTLARDAGPHIEHVAGPASINAYGYSVRQPKSRFGAVCNEACKNAMEQTSTAGATSVKLCAWRASCMARTGEASHG